MKILIAEDEPDIWKPYKIALEARNHEVVVTENGEECLEIYQQELLDQTKSSSSSSSSSSKKTITTPITNNNGDNNNTSLTLLPLPPFDVVVLDYRMPKRDGMEVAKEILELNPHQRIIFASAYVKETLEDSVKQLKQVVELMQKPFEADALVDTIEDKEVYQGLKKLMINVRQMDKESEPTEEQIKDLFEGLRKIQKGRTF
jgi:CheY-like chemotaxis protein